MDAQENQQDSTKPITQPEKNLQQQQHKQPEPKKPTQTKLVKQENKYKLLQNLQLYFEKGFSHKLSQSFYNTFSIIQPTDPDRQRFAGIFKEIAEKPKDFKPELLGLDIKLERGVACFLGLAICDALGASTQFIHFQKQRRNLIAYDFLDVVKQIKQGVLNPRSGKVGIWTDDCSMALCMADSLLLNNYNFNPKHMRYMFHMWLEHGHCNGGRPYSIGLGGNISISMGQFAKHREEYTAEGDKFNNGNGSLMRLAPIPLCYVNDQNKGMDIAGKQSRTTHNGDQAKQCSKLLTLILIRLINRGEQPDWKSVIDKACTDFVNNAHPMKTVLHLALSEQEPLQLYEQQKDQYKRKFTKFNHSPQDRNWNWKDPNFTYSECRTEDQPGYIGSYCMDALAMALHTVWHSKSFEEVALINANMGGDCDTVGAIAGQIAGAIYGITPYMMHLYSQMVDFQSKRFDVFLKAYKLLTHNPI